MSSLKKKIDSTLPAILTGSQKYGIPRDDSDIDLVVFIDNEDDLKELLMWAEVMSAKLHTQGYNGISLRFGRLNLIVVNDKNTYDGWKMGTNFLSQIKPVTKEIACLMFDTFFKINKAPGCV